MNLNRPAEDYQVLEDGSVVVRSVQELGSDYWTNLKEAQEEFSFRLNGLTPVASIPVAVANKWLREGFDVWNATAKEIQAKLRADEMTKFLVTEKTF